MSAAVFEGLPDAFAETFGEAVIYTPADSGVALLINAIWIEEPVTAFDGLASVGADDVNVTLHVRSADVPQPAAGDCVERVATGKTGRVVSPIRPDGMGMIALTLEAAT